MLSLLPHSYIYFVDQISCCSCVIAVVIIVTVVVVNVKVHSVVCTDSEAEAGIGRLVR